VKFAFISEMDVEKAYPVAFMCTMLEVSRSAYYDWKDRTPSPAARRREALAAMITAIFEANHGTYGYRRVHAVLARSGVAVSSELIRPVDARAGPGALPAAAVAADHHRGRRVTSHTRPTRPGLHRRGAGHQAGRRHHLYPDRRGLGLSGHGDRLEVHNEYLNEQLAA
jgi:hypothetical protein